MKNPQLEREIKTQKDILEKSLKRLSESFCNDFTWVSEDAWKASFRLKVLEDEGPIKLKKEVLKLEVSRFWRPKSTNNLDTEEWCWKQEASRELLEFFERLEDSLKRAND